jgi:hypothetical protein
MASFLKKYYALYMNPGRLGAAKGGYTIQLVDQAARSDFKKTTIGDSVMIGDIGF